MLLLLLLFKFKYKPNYVETLNTWLVNDLVNIITCCLL